MAQSLVSFTLKRETKYPKCTQPRNQKLQNNKTRQSTNFTYKKHHKLHLSHISLSERCQSQRLATELMMTGGSHDTNLLHPSIKALTSTFQAPKQIHQPLTAHIAILQWFEEGDDAGQLRIGLNWRTLSLAVLWELCL